MEHFEQQLQTLWQQGGRDIALSFLRRAISMDMPLGRLMAALNFQDVSHHLSSITLREILATDGARPASTEAAPAAGTRAPRQQGSGRRKRRSADELTAIKKQLARLLLAEPGSLNTTQMVSALKSEGKEIDSMKVNSLLRTLEADAFVIDLGGKPKSWRATAKLRSDAAANT